MTHSLMVSVLIPTFNRDMFIAETLDSVVMQLRLGDEIIVIDDGSTDGTPALLSSDRWPIRYLRQDNAGKSVAVDRGISAAEGDLIWIVDDDDVMAADALEKMRRPLEADDSIGFTFGHYDYLVEESGAWVIQPTPVFHRQNEPLHLSLLRRCFFFQSGMLVRKRCYNTVGNFDVTLRRSQDYDMILRLSRIFKGVEVQGPLFHQRQHNGQRGVGDAAVAAGNRGRAWMKYDGQIFDRIQAIYSLDEFGDMVRHRGTNHNVDLEIAARVVRATVMARRAQWLHAATDLDVVAHRLKDDPKQCLSDAELNDLSTIFGWAGYGLIGLSDSPPFFAALARLPRREAARALSAVARPLPSRLKTAVRQRQYDNVRSVISAGAMVISTLTKTMIRPSGVSK